MSNYLDTPKQTISSTGKLGSKLGQDRNSIVAHHHAHLDDVRGFAIYYHNGDFKLC